VTAPTAAPVAVDCKRCGGQGEVLAAGDPRGDNFELATCSCCDGRGEHATARRCLPPSTPRRKQDGAW
jgi:DnaJ-class molecular chaperone